MNGEESTPALTGTQHAFLTSVDAAKGTITFDLVEWFEEAQAAAACKPLACRPPTASSTRSWSRSATDHQAGPRRHLATALAGRRATRGPNPLNRA